ncbi:DUF2249 domain-containing protein [Mycolicibacterium flavescens]|uniref:DUF2249 domain-containing protein n=1 Tax=Mycolicibacterium flavescens TaxID=1776 RepID=UPI001F38669E|nr:DUF2249 domain-containing protein [Mycolicibacterium flavescens]
MTESEPLSDSADVLDVRRIPKSRRHATAFARFDALRSGESFVLVNCHDPIRLREEFARCRPGAYAWRYLEGSQSQRLWRIRITRIAEGVPFGAGIPMTDLSGSTRADSGAVD